MEGRGAENMRGDMEPPMKNMWLKVFVGAMNIEQIFKLKYMEQLIIWAVSTSKTLYDWFQNQVPSWKKPRLVLIAISNMADLLISEYSSYQKTSFLSFVIHNKVQ